MAMRSEGLTRGGRCSTFVLMEVEWLEALAGRCICAAPTLVLFSSSHLGAERSASGIFKMKVLHRSAHETIAARLQLRYDVIACGTAVMYPITCEVGGIKTLNQSFVRNSAG